MSDMLTPRLQRSGGGAYMLDRIRTQGSPNIAFCQPGWVGYKLKFRSSGDWDKNGTTARAAATSQVITLATTFEDSPFPTNVVVAGVLINVITAWTGLTTPTLSVGDAGNDDEWVDLFDLTSTAGAYYVDTGDSDAVNAAGGFLVPETAYAPIVTLGTGAENLTALTAGEVDVLFLCIPIPRALPD